MMKRIVALLLTLAVALCAALPVLAAGTIEVTEDVSVSDAYDWTRFKGQNVTLNVYNWGEYISNGSDDSVDVVRRPFSDRRERIWNSFIIKAPPW